MFKKWPSPHIVKKFNIAKELNSSNYNDFFRFFSLVFFLDFTGFQNSSCFETGKTLKTYKVLIFFLHSPSTLFRANFLYPRSNPVLDRIPFCAAVDSLLWSLEFESYELTTIPLGHLAWSDFCLIFVDLIFKYDHAWCCKS